MNKRGRRDLFLTKRLFESSPDNSIHSLQRLVLARKSGGETCHSFVIPKASLRLGAGTSRIDGNPVIE